MIDILTELEVRMGRRGYGKGAVDSVELVREGKRLVLVEESFEDVFNGVHGVLIDIYMRDLKEEVDLLNDKYDGD